MWIGGSFGSAYLQIGQLSILFRILANLEIGAPFLALPLVA